MDTSTAHRWSFLLITGFVALVSFGLFQIYLQSGEPIPVETLEPLSAPTFSVINPSMGPTSARVTITTFEDFSCEACRDLSTTLANIAAEFPDDVRIVWKDFPNEDLHPEATRAAIAARCAQEQNAFWEYHDLLYTQSSRLGDPTYMAIAETLNLNVNGFETCLREKRTLPRVQRDFEEGLRLSITATPTIFVNGERSIGAITKTDLEALIRSILSP